MYIFFEKNKFDKMIINVFQSQICFSEKHFIQKEAKK